MARILILASRENGKAKDAAKALQINLGADRAAGHDVEILGEIPQEFTARQEWEIDQKAQIDRADLVIPVVDVGFISSEPGNGFIGLNDALASAVAQQKPVRPLIADYCVYAGLSAIAKNRPVDISGAKSSSQAITQFAQGILGALKDQSITPPVVASEGAMATMQQKIAELEEKVERLKEQKNQMYQNYQQEGARADLATTAGERQQVLIDQLQHENNQLYPYRFERCVLTKN